MSQLKEPLMPSLTLATAIAILRAGRSFDEAARVA
jgi:hypothetical protein